MDSEQVNRLVSEIEHQLRIDDPALVRRVERRFRREAARVIAVLFLLMFSVVLLAAGLASVSPVAYCVGVVAFFAAFVADRLLGWPDG